MLPKNVRERKELRKQTHGWFHTPGRPGDRTLEQQLRGLDYVFAESAGKIMLDVGCAEGLISMEFATRGQAQQVDAFEMVQGHVDLGMQIMLERSIYNMNIVQGDANEFEPRKTYDIMLMLAVLHKLREPAKCCARIARYCTDLCVIRMGPDGKDMIVDERSNKVPQYIGGVMEELGFVVERKELGPFDEMTWYYRKKK